jgi:asparagine synthase (glutamine-hydrolysing)
LVLNPAVRGHIYLNADLFQQWLVRPFAEPFEEIRFTDNLLRNRMLNELFHEATPVILKEDDLNSMYYSVENRSPYLDRGLAEFLYTVPAEHLIKDGYAKWLLRAAGEGVVADPVRLDKRKRGFNASIDSLVDRANNETRDRLLADGPIFDIVRRDAIESFLDGSMADNSFSKFLFSFISAQTFLEHHRDWRP